MTVTVTSIAGGAPKPVFDILAPRFLAQTGHRHNALYDSMAGIASRVAAHEGFDVLVMPVPMIDAYEKDGIVKPASCTALANIGLAVGVRAGSKLPDISTPDAFRHALSAARSVVHAPPNATPSGAHSNKVIKELGLAEILKGRVIHKVGLAGGLAAIGSGEADIGIFPKSEIVSGANVTLVGPLPDAIQLVITYGAGVVAASPVAGPAAALIGFLVTPESRAVWLACGFDAPP